MVDLDSLNETVKSLNWPSSMQQADPQIVHQLTALVRTKGVQRSTRVRFHCEQKRDRHSKARFMLERAVCDTERRDTEPGTAFVFML